MSDPHNKMSDEEHLEAFKSKIQEIAEREHIHPREVSSHLAQRKYRYYRSGYTKRTKWEDLLDRVFPPDPSPFDRYRGLDLEELDDHEISEHIFSVMIECSRVIKVELTDLSWYEFRRYIKFRYGENDGGIARYAITKVGGFLAIRDAYNRPKPTKLSMERQRTQVVAKLNRKIGREDSDREFVLDRITEHCSKIFKKAFSIQVCCKNQTQNLELNRILTLVLSDLHFGSDILGEETGALSFGRVEESRRFSYICHQTANFKLEHRDRTELNILVLGDIVQGSLHDPRDGAVLAEQISRAIHVMVQGFTYLGAHFPKIKIRFSPGNHDRFTSRHKQRAVNQKWDSILWVIGMAIKYALAQFKNIEIEMPKTPYLSFDLFGQAIMATHGDSVINTGYPSSTINTKMIESQINKLNASLPDSKQFKMVICGHVHQGLVLPMSNGTTLLINPSMVPPDQHGVSLGIWESESGQWLFESVEGHLLGDFRLIKVSSIQDKNVDLDQIIQPWSDD